MAKNPMQLANTILDSVSEPQPEVGKIIQYNPYVRNSTTGEFEFGENPIRARQLHNGMAVETKKADKDHTYFGHSGRYKVVDLETGLMVGWVNNYDDGITLSQDKDFLEKIRLAKEARKRLRHED